MRIGIKVRSLGHHRRGSVGSLALGSGLGADAYRWLARALSALAAGGNLGCPSAFKLRPTTLILGGITVQGSKLWHNGQASAVLMGAGHGPHD